MTQPADPDLTHVRHAADGMVSDVVYSPCGTYRYALTRTWDPDQPKIAFVMLNPSTADAMRNDPTVERCERRARQMGYGAMRVVNLFAFRATKPSDLKATAAPEGPENMAVLLAAADWADMVLCAWGAHGDHMAQAAKAEAALRAAGHTLHHIGLTKHGHPRHPLYVSYAVTPALWA